MKRATIMVVGFGVLALLIAGVAAGSIRPSSGRQHHAGGQSTDVVTITYTKWFLSATSPNMKGFTGGGVVGTFGGAVLNFKPAAKGAAFQVLHVRYVITATNSQRSFTARLDGKQNIKLGTAVLNGVVTVGWRKGASVHVEFKTITCKQSAGGCYRGTIRVGG